MKALAILKIKESPESKSIHLRLMRDGDSYRWIEQRSGADTEVSAPTIAKAKEAALLAWRNWNPRATWIK